jgi:hypothetical protein
MYIQIFLKKELRMSRKNCFCFGKAGVAFCALVGFLFSIGSADQTLYVITSKPIYVGNAKQATKVFMTFSDSLQKQSAEIAANYEITNETQAVTVQSAKMGIDHATCTLTVTPLVNYELFSLATKNVYSALGDSLLPGSDGAFVTGIQIEVGNNITIALSDVDTVPLVSTIIGFDSLPSTTYISNESWSKVSGPINKVTFSKTNADLTHGIYHYTAYFTTPGTYVLKYVLGVETCVQKLIGAQVEDSLTVTVLANSGVVSPLATKKMSHAVPHSLVNIGSSAGFSGLSAETRNSSHVRVVDVTGRYAGSVDKMRKVPGVYFLKTR